MFSITEHTFDQSASQIDQLHNNDRYSAKKNIDASMVSDISAYEGEMIETLPVKHMHIYIHNFHVPSEYVPIMHAVRVQYGKIDPKTGLFIVK